MLNGRHELPDLFGHRKRKQPLKTNNNYINTQKNNVLTRTANPFVNHINRNLNYLRPSGQNRVKRTIGENKKIRNFIFNSIHCSRDRASTIRQMVFFMLKTKNK